MNRVTFLPLTLYLYFAGLSCFVFSLAAACVVPAMASTTDAELLRPNKTIEEVVDAIRKTVQESEGKLTPEVIDDKLRELISPVFDFKSMARSSLAQNWQKATPEQQTEYVELFSDLLAQTYLKRIRDNIASSEFNLVEERIKGKKAIVRTKVNYDEDQTAAIDYRMRLKKSNWLVYDVIVENIGLVSNYRSEFAGIVKKEKIEGLLVRLREKKAGDKEPK